MFGQKKTEKKHGFRWAMKKIFSSKKSSKSVGSIDEIMIINKSEIIIDTIFSEHSTEMIVNTDIDVLFDDLIITQDFSKPDSITATNSSDTEDESVPNTPALSTTVSAELMIPSRDTSTPPPSVVISESPVDKLLLRQRSKHGFSMYDLIIPERLPEVKAIIEDGNTFDEAALMIFETFTEKLESPKKKFDKSILQTNKLRLDTPPRSPITPKSNKEKAPKAMRRMSSAPGRPAPYHKALSRSASECTNQFPSLAVSPSVKTVGLSKRNPFAKQGQVNVQPRTPTSRAASLASSSAEVWDSDDFM